MLTGPVFLDILSGAKDINIDGFSLRYSAGDNQGSDSVFLTVIGRDGKYHPVEVLSLENY